MAQKFSVSYQTVQTHFRHIRKFFHVHKTIEILQAVRPLKVKAHNIVLTPREHEIFLLVERGFTTKCIACNLCISISTVRRHKEKMLLVNECKTLQELVSKYQGTKRHARCAPRRPRKQIQKKL